MCNHITICSTRTCQSSLLALFLNHRPAINQAIDFTLLVIGTRSACFDLKGQYQNYLSRCTTSSPSSHRSPDNSPHKGQWRRAWLFSLICAWITVWINNREAGDFRRHRAHYDVTVMPNAGPTLCHHCSCRRHNRSRLRVFWQNFVGHRRFRKKYLWPDYIIPYGFRDLMKLRSTHQSAERIVSSFMKCNHPCPNANGGLIKLPLKLAYEWASIFQSKPWI